MLEIPSLLKSDLLLNAVSAGWDRADLQERSVTLARCRVFFDFDNTISLFDVPSPAPGLR